MDRVDLVFPVILAQRYPGCLCLLSDLSLRGNLGVRADPLHRWLGFRVHLEVRSTPEILCLPSILEIQGIQVHLWARLDFPSAVRSPVREVLEILDHLLDLFLRRGLLDLEHLSLL